jgi:hypothetical protein
LRGGPTCCGRPRSDPAASPSWDFAVDQATGDIYYFGEDVDTHRNGKMTGHEGAWLTGVNGDFVLVKIEK